MKAPISMRLDPQLLEAAKSAASKEHRSLANLVEVALAERIGYDLEARRLVVTVAAPAAAMRGARIVPSSWEAVEEIAQVQANFDRLIELAEAAEQSRGPAGEPQVPKPHRKP